MPVFLSISARLCVCQAALVRLVRVGRSVWNAQCPTLHSFSLRTAYFNCACAHKTSLFLYNFLMTLSQNGRLNSSLRLFFLHLFIFSYSHSFIISINFRAFDSVAFFTAGDRFSLSKIILRLSCSSKRVTQTEFKKKLSLLNESDKYVARNNLFFLLQLAKCLMGSESKSILVMTHNFFLFTYLFIFVLRTLFYLKAVLFERYRYWPGSKLAARKHLVTHFKELMSQFAVILFIMSTERKLVFSSNGICHPSTTVLLSTISEFYKRLTRRKNKERIEERN